jgi:hypothetical protein
VRTLSGNGDVEHVALMANTTVFSMIDAFLANQTVPPAPLALRSQLAASGTVATQRIVVAGSSYVHIVDSLGNDNAKVSDMSAKQIPGVTITYGGSEAWVDISAASTVDLTIQEAATDPPIEVTVIQFAADGTALSLRRYRFDPSGHIWQGHISPATAASVTDPVVSVDTNDNGTYEPSEQIQPTQTSGSGPVDVTAPSLSMTLSPAGDSVAINLTATDNVTASPLIRYSINGGEVQTYTGPFSVASSQSVVLKAYAEDDMGNTSGLVTTNVRPVLSLSNQGGCIGLSWPLDDAYVLEETTDLIGPWTTSSAQITRSTFSESATMPIGTTTRKFFRLRSQVVTK